MGVFASSSANQCGSECSQNVYNYYGSEHNDNQNERNLIEGPVGKPGKMGARGEPGPTGFQGQKVRYTTFCFTLYNQYGKLKL